MPSLTTSNSKDLKSRLGRTATARTPLSIRSEIGLDDAFKEQVRARLGRGLDPFATLIERGTVRFEDINGPRGGVDTVCRIKIVIDGHDESVIVEQVGEDAAAAFALAAPRVIRTVRRSIAKRGEHARRPTLAIEKSADLETPYEPLVEDTIIGRTAGRHEDNLARALARPEKDRGDALVDTAAVGTSATDRRAGGEHTARRNTRATEEGTTATLEDSLTKPSRKSTRRSGDRQKSGTQLERRQTREVTSPQKRAMRANAGS